MGSIKGFYEVKLNAQVNSSKKILAVVLPLSSMDMFLTSECLRVE